MLKRIRLLALSVFFLLYTEGLLHADPTHYSFRDEDNFVPAPGLLHSDIPQPLPVRAAGAAPPPKQSNAAKGSFSKGKRQRRSAKAAPATGHKSKVTAPQSLTTTNTPDVEILRDDYRELTGRELHVTSEGRTPYTQALAMYNNLVRYGSAKVVATYRNKRAARQIARAFESNRRKPRRAIAAMTAVITRQMSEGILISNHLRGKAVDLRSWGAQRARVKPLRQIARSRGWRVLVEPSHIHVDLS